MGVCCVECQKTFSCQSNFKRHRKEVHKAEVSPIEFDKQIANFQCLEGCNISFKKNDDLRKHLSQKHNIIQETVEKAFMSYEEFEIWLSLEENACDIRYIKVGHKRGLDIPGNGSYGDKSKDIMYFSCSRSGKQRTVPHENLKKNSKIQGTSKINSACTSQIVVQKLKNGECYVKYYKSHYGHAKDLHHLRISKVSKENIASKLVKGVSKNEILDGIRENTCNCNRDSLLTLQDIRNIQTSYKINVEQGFRHKNDNMNVSLRVEEWKQWEENPILLYKEHNSVEFTEYNFQKEDFCLIFMNKMQNQMLKKFGKNIICIDTTHDVDFELTTILIIDEFYHSFPTAFMFTNRKDTYIYEVFFNEVKKAVGEIKIKVLMTDMTGVFVNAWQKVMGPIGRHLFCAWHVDRGWQQNLSKVQPLEDRKWVYKTLKHLQTTLNEERFERGLCSFLSILESKYRTFFEYFFTNYADNKLKWAYCYRKKSGITNIHVENMHKVIKYIYPERKSVPRLDKALYNLEHFLRNKTIERLIKLTEGECTEHINTVNKRHRLALTQKYQINTDSDNVYLLKNSSGNDELEQKVTVTKINSNICCELICRFCNICTHMFQCTCMDYNIKNTICKHIHYVCLNNLGNTCTRKVEIEYLAENLGSNVQKHIEILQKQITAAASQITENVKSRLHQTDVLEQILQGLTPIVALSKISDNKI
ncbi:uncharacterized protein LOC132696141 [Cylas formicarius]|uniref:uncharacterized protein LOC132696141 n=1 Tax=Cylas formicarius TaxID=197179 RepID=UPI00295844C4|nr:uncharacterized protein LOC132696141 [Cylas formicarius]